MKAFSRAATAADLSKLGIGTALVNLTMAFLAMAALAAVSFSPSRAKAAEAAAGQPIRIVALGDSLTAGYGLRPGQSFPEILQVALRARGHNVEIVNAGVSGDTTAGGLERLDWAVGHDAEAVIVELGANDALRGLPPETARANLDEIMKRLSARRLPVLLAGMKAPENWGTDYKDKFAGIFGDLAEKYDTLLYPFFLDGIALDPKLNLADGLHPNPHGVAIIVERILPKVELLLHRAAQKREHGSPQSTAGKS